MNKKQIEARNAILVANMTFAQVSGQPMLAQYVLSHDSDTWGFLDFAVRPDGKLILLSEMPQNRILVAQYAVINDDMLRKETTFEIPDDDEFDSYQKLLRSEVAEWSRGVDNRWTF